MLPALIGAGTALLGGFLGNQMNTGLARETNASNREQAEGNQIFQERMSSTAYQRAMEDMRRAGLNPILAYNQGGASSPSGSTIASVAPHYQDPIAPAVATAADIYNKKGTLDNAAKGLGIAEGGLAVQQAQQKVQDANSKADIALKSAQTAATVSSAKKTETESEILRSKAKREKLEGDFFSSDAGKSYFYLDKINQAAGGSLDTVSSALKVISPFKGAKEIMKPGRGMMKDGTKFNTTTGEVIP